MTVTSVSAGILAHGGTAGAAAELAFIVVPIVLFSVLSRVARRRREREEAQAQAEAEAGAQTDGESDPEAIT